MGLPNFTFYSKNEFKISATAAGDRSCDGKLSTYLCFSPKNFPGTYSACPMSKRAFSDPLNPETIGSVDKWHDCSALCQVKALQSLNLNLIVEKPPGKVLLPILGMDRKWSSGGR